MARPNVYRIHPAIGVARVGDSEEFFIGPEIPGRLPEGVPPLGVRVPPFKDAAGRIRRQAARFRIWRYVDDGTGRYKPDEEIDITTKGVRSIEWQVHLANKKAEFFEFRGLLGDPVFGPKRAVSHNRRNAAPRPDRRTLWIDPGFRRVTGRDVSGVEFRKGTAPSGAAEFWPSPAPSPPIEYLGELRTDSLGRLIVLGGRGLSSAVGDAPIKGFANNDGWFDDVSDGPVTATIRFGSGKQVAALGAWLLCGPPDFAPFAENVVTLYDTLFDLAARELVIPGDETIYDGALRPLKELNTELRGVGWEAAKLGTYTPSFDAEIWPILRRGLEAVFLYAPAGPRHTLIGAHGNLAAMYAQLGDPSAGSAAIRKVVFEKLHPPGVDGDGYVGGVPRATMPRMGGDDPYGEWKALDRLCLTVTPTQYALLDRWVNGSFLEGGSAPPQPPTIPTAVPMPDQLDRAPLDAAVGGGFYPGIEVCWMIRHPSLYLEPFRIKHGAPSAYISDVRSRTGAGFFSRQMAVPWQADFLSCALHETPPTRSGHFWSWWPAQRPVAVYPNEAATAKGTSMEEWTRSTKSGATVNWPSGPNGPTKAEMVANWASFGFVHKKGDVQFETERKPDVP